MLYTSSSVQLFYKYLGYYDSKKTSYGLKKFNPMSLLCFFIDDGTLANGLITISSNSFSKSENDHLLHCLNQIGILGKVFEQYDVKTEKVYYRILIDRYNTQKFLKYLEKAPKDSLSLAKQLFPWKFTPNLRKRDVIRDQDYILTFLDLLAHSLAGSGEKFSLRAKRLLQRFPWNEILFHSALY